MKRLKVNVSEIKVGSKLITWFNNEVEVLEIVCDKSFKPLVVGNGTETQYFHFSQIEKILS